MAESDSSQERPSVDVGQDLAATGGEVWGPPVPLPRDRAAPPTAPPVASTIHPAAAALDPTELVKPARTAGPPSSAGAVPPPASNPPPVLPTASSPVSGQAAVPGPKAETMPPSPSTVRAPAPPAPPRAGAELGTPWSVSGRHLEVRTSPIKAAGAVVVVVALLAAGLAYLAPKAGKKSHQLTLAFVTGRDYRYSFSGVLDGTATEGAVANRSRETFKGTLLLHVVSVDREGVSTVRASFVNASYRVDGKRTRLGSKLGGKLMIAPDGRVLSGSGGVATAGGSATILAGLDQLTPLLPQEPVSPGATWSTTFSQQIPFADTPIRVTGQNTLVNYERVGGSASAVVTSDITMPLELSIDAGKLLASAGGKVDPKMAKATLGVTGSISLFQTSWLDPVAKEFTESSVLGHVDIAVSMSGTDGGAAQAGARFEGTLTVQVYRVGADGSGISGPDRQARDALRRALAAADLYFAASHTFKGFTEAKASSVAPSLQWRVGGKTAPGVITIRVTTGSSVLLLTQDADGKPMCIARTRAGTTRYGRIGAARPVGCRGGW